MALWGGRFNKKMDQYVRHFNDSFPFDRRLFAADIAGSIAYSSALVDVGILSEEEFEKLHDGLEKIRLEFEEGVFKIHSEDEDIHTSVERRLGEIVGEVAGKIHTGRSRNDQVTTDLRLYLLAEISILGEMVVEFQKALIDLAENNLDLIMPGYTHLQRAQPVLFSHWAMSNFWKLQRDLGRLRGAARRTNVNPLGAGALAGNSFAVDRTALTEMLGFESTCENSIDAVSDRDYVVEFLAWAALIQTHMSQWAEDLILWSSSEFGFLQIDEAFTTGSSLMPQKKNPDTLELIRGKHGRVAGHLVGVTTMLKGLPSAYNKDFQEDKEALFDVIDTLIMELPIAADITRTLQVNQAAMAAALDEGMFATDLADYLVHQGITFRRSHHYVGQVVRRAEELGVALSELGLDEYQSIHPAFGDGLYQVFDPKRSINAKSVLGGTATRSVQDQIRKAKEIISKPVGE